MTVREYLAGLPPERRAALQVVRKIILENLDADIEECIQHGMIGYEVPHRVYPAGYHCDPKMGLPVACLASRKNSMSIGFLSTYSDPSEAKWLRAAWARTGKKLDMGKCCIRFRKVDDLPLEVIGEAVRRVPARRVVATYDKMRAGKARPSPRKPVKGRR